MNIGSYNSTVTLFHSFSTVFNGLGVTLRLFDTDTTDSINLSTKLSNFKFKFTKVLIKISDPGMSTMNFSNYTDMDVLFNNAPYSTDSSESIPSTASRFFYDIRTAGINIIPCFLVPVTWLALDNSNLVTGEPAITSVANFILSGVQWIRNFGNIVTLVEIFHHPELENNTHGYMSAQEFPLLARKIRTLSIARNMEPEVKLVGPGISQVISETEADSIYLDEFYEDNKNVLDFFSIHANENTSTNTDVTLLNQGNFDSRQLLKKGLTKETYHMYAINFITPRIVTNFTTNATKFIENGTNYGNGASDTIHFAKRVIDNFCIINNLGYSVAIYSNLNEKTDEEPDNKSLYDSDNVLRPVGELLKYITNNIPIPSNIWFSEELNKDDDFTIKTMFLTSNGSKFFIILSRPPVSDNLLGNIKLYIENPLWSTAYTTSNVIINSYPEPQTEENPSGVPISDIVIQSSFGQGRLSIKMQHLPYNCILFLSGDVSLAPPSPAPVPTPSPTPGPGGPSPSPVVMETIIQVPVNYGIPTSTDHAQGTVFYDSQAHTLKTFISGSWVVANMLDHI